MSNELKNKIIELTGQIIRADNPGAAVDIVIEIDTPKEKKFGDWSLNIAMKLAKYYKKPPVEIAKGLSEKLSNRLNENKLGDKIEKFEIKPPGFINIFLSNNALYDVIEMIKQQRDDFGRTKPDKKQKVLIEFVSANPTGPLSIAHARQAAGVQRILYK